MGPTDGAIAVSLGGLSAALGVLAVRGFVHASRTRKVAQALWAAGLALGAAAMAIELFAYVGVVSEALLEAYVFLSAAIVGVLSLGAVASFRRPRLTVGYSAYQIVALATTGVVSFTTALPRSMVSRGIIVGDPPLSLIVLSTLVTGPATVVLLASAFVSLRRSFRWSHVTMIAGACVLGAGGTLYLASFPVVLYYAEFVGIVLLFAGLVNLSRVAAPAPAATTVARPQ